MRGSCHLTSLKLIISTNNLLQAIQWAGIECEADIISMSFGVSRDPRIEQAIMEVQTHRRRNVIFFASAGNSGAHEDVAFPACCEGVISVRAADNLGSAARTNPGPGSNEAYSFATFGDSIPERLRRHKPEVCNPGSSISTAVAAGMAAMMLSYTSLLPGIFPGQIDESRIRKLWTARGMESLFLTLSGDVVVGNRVRFVNPVRFFTDKPRNLDRLWAIGDCINKIK